jgi:hypothetical protein
MASFPIGGQSSGDFRETSARVQLFHVVTRNSVGIMTPDTLTQANPPVVTGATTKSTTLANVTKTGVLGGSIAFTRPDFGNGFHGGPVKVGGVYVAGLQPLGIFLNDAVGNAFENTPGVASGRAPYVCGNGTTVGVSIYETKKQIVAAPGDPITFAVGDKVYASVNGLLTNVVGDTYENNVAGTPAPTLIGVVKVAPDANSVLLVIDVRI